METGTIVSFQTESLVKVEARWTLTAPHTLLPALAHGCSRPGVLGRQTARGTEGHTVRKHLISRTDTTWKDRGKRGLNRVKGPCQLLHVLASCVLYIPAASLLKTTVIAYIVLLILLCAHSPQDTNMVIFHYHIGWLSSML